MNESLKNIFLHKNITYSIEILNISNDVPDEFIDDFKEWLKCKSVETGCGKHCESYYDHDESAQTPITVCFFVKLT